MSVEIEEAIQEARTLRDQGFIRVQAAVEVNDTGPLEAARGTLSKALDCTAPFISGLIPVMGNRLLNRRTPRLIYKEIAAEHGATLGLVGRLATAEQVLLEEDTTGESAEAVEARNIEQQSYGLAHMYLRLGNRPDILEANARFAARQEIINDRKANAAVWLLRATYGEVLSTLSPSLSPSADWSSEQPGSAGYTEHLPLRDLASRERALASALSLP